MDQFLQNLNTYKGKRISVYSGAKIVVKGELLGVKDDQIIVETPTVCTFLQINTKQSSFITAPWDIFLQIGE